MKIRNVIAIVIMSIFCCSCTAQTQQKIVTRSTDPKKNATLQTLLYAPVVEKFTFSTRITDDSYIFEISGVDKDKIYQLQSEYIDIKQVAVGSKMQFALPKKVGVYSFYEDGKKLKKITISQT